MRRFSCTACGNRVHFQNDVCVACGHALGFAPDTIALVALEPDGNGEFRPCGRLNALVVQFCANHSHGACNWLTAAGAPGALCVACQLNRTIPNLSEPGNLEAWREIEQAKKRLVYSLLRFALPVDGTSVGKGRLTFDFMRGAMTGHADGVITIDLDEADAVQREKVKQMFNEQYRSLLGHLRHESGHFYFTLLVEAGGRIEEFRRVFGDERPDYGTALAAYHENGPVADWPQRFVSAYASAHPAEDWAETWAHYLHMVDAIDTAEAVGLEPRAAGLVLGAAWPFKPYDIYREETFQALVERWVPLTLAMNDLSRSLGHEDYYPFVIPPPAYQKLAFVHRAVRESARKPPANPRLLATAT